MNEEFDLGSACEYIKGKIITMFAFWKKKNILKIVILKSLARADEVNI